MRGSILALDLGSSLGWARASARAVAAWPELSGMVRGCGPFDGVRYGTLDMRNTKPLAARFTRFYRWLAQELDDSEITHIYFETSLPPRNQSSTNAGRIAFGLAGIVQAVAWDHLVSLTDIAPATIKKHFTGSGRAQKGDILKACRTRGWAPDSDDCADALALLDLAATRYISRGIAA